MITGLNSYSQMNDTCVMHGDIFFLWSVSQHSQDVRTSVYEYVNIYIYAGLA